MFTLFCSLLESIKITESHEDLDFIRSELFNSENGYDDYSLSLKDTITGVVYAVDFKIATGTNNFKIDRIDIQDHGYEKPKISDGNTMTFALVNDFIKNNLSKIIDSSHKFYT